MASTTKVFQLLVILVLMHETISEGGYILDPMPNVVDRLWSKVSDNWMFTTGANLAKFFSKYDPRQQSSLSLFENNFVNGESNFFEEFQEYGVNYESAHAYFRSLDVIEYWLYMRLTIEDMDMLVDICDKHTKGLGLGFISGAQFKKGFTQVVFRGLPFSLLFVRNTKDAIPYFKPLMRQKDFLKMFRDMDANGNGRLTAKEVGRFWDRGGFGPPEKGKEFFESLNYRDTSYLNTTDWTDLFHDLDCVSEKGTKDGKLTHREFLQMDDILHGLRLYPSDTDCVMNKGIITPGQRLSEKEEEKIITKT